MVPARTPTSSNSAAGVPTLTTPTLTPTTLRNIEQMFLESEAAFEVRPPDPHENAARFEPPAISLTEVVASASAVADPRIIKQEWMAPPPLVAAATDGSVLPGPYSNDKLFGAAVLPGPNSAAPSRMSLPTTRVLSGPNNGGPSRLSLPITTVLPGSNATATARQSFASAFLPGSNATFTRLSLPTVPSLPPPGVIELPTAPMPPKIELPSIPLHLLPSEPVQLNNNVNGVAFSNPHPPPLPTSSGGSRNKTKVGRSNADMHMLTPVESGRKHQRRQRNKEAAARCRKRRLDQTLGLQDEVDRWESSSSDLREEIRSLESKKGELEGMLNEHRCMVPASVATTGIKAVIKKEEPS
jgi:hypothetical protein